MSIQEIVDDVVLEHFGTKGMKWGVRRERHRAVERAGREAAAAKRKELGIGRVTSGLRPSDYSKARQVNKASRQAMKDVRRAQKTERRMDKADAKLEKRLSSKSKSFEMKRQFHNTIGPIVQSKVNQINTKPEYAKAIRNGTFQNPNHPTTKKYIKEYNKLYLNEMNSYLSGFQSQSGRKVVRAELNSEDSLGFTLRLHDKPGVKHADSDLMRINYIKDENGAIIGFELVKDEMEQSSNVNYIIDDVLEHFGVKGMKWGVRNTRERAGDVILERGFAISTTGSRARGAARSAKRASTPVKVVDKGKKLKTSGGKGRPAHPDALEAHKIGQIVKKSGPKAVSNQDLQKYANRLQIEQNVSRLSGNQKNAGLKVSQIVLKQAGNKAIQEVTGGAMSQIKKTLLKRMR